MAVLIWVPLMSDRPSLACELIRLEADAAEGGAAAHRPGPSAGVGVGVALRPGDEGVALADDDEGEVGQRGEVAAGADAALLRDRRRHAAVVHLDQRVD